MKTPSNPRRRSLAWLVLSMSVAGILANAKEAPVPAFAAGDRVCFIGDSITHSGSYTSYALLFYATRLPRARFEAFNCGISGDTAEGAMRRFGPDIAVHRPTVATVMLGMNDVRRDLYGEPDVTPDHRVQRQRAIDRHAAKMEALAGQLDALGCRIIFLTPSIYDQTAALPEKNYRGTNDALAACAELGRALASRHQAAVVDFNGVMAQINAEAQAKDPTFTITSADRVHPGEPGHLVMAYLLLKAQGLPGTVAAVKIDAVAGTATGERCTVSNLRADRSTVSFDYLAESLPFPVGKRAVPALSLVPFMAELNREPLTITGLRPGNYEVLIDDQPVWAASADELSRGVDFAGNDRTPQLRQAHEAKTINDRRHELVSRRLRTIRQVDHFFVSLAKGLDPSDQAAVDAYIAECLQRAKAAGKSYEVTLLETYQQWKPRQSELEQEIAEATEALWKACQPKVRRYLIRPKA